MKPTQTCAYCGEPVQGRADKRYCDNICKSRDFREREKAHTTVVINNVPPTVEASTSQPLHHSPQRDAAVDERTSDTPAKPVRPIEKSLQQQVDESFAVHHERYHCNNLHRDYSTTIRTFLEGLGQPLSLARLESMKRHADQLVENYRTHPGIKRGEELFLRRLDDLYLVQDALGEAVAVARQQPFWATKAAGYEVPDKKRRKMRERLIA